ncbi:MAG TPA: ribonuclease P protein component [Steroidobacteraceae bacterium]
MAAAVMTAAPTRSAAAGFRFPRARRLRRPIEFKRAYAVGQRLGDEFFTINVKANEHDGARLGMSVAARILRRAVDRNRLRRLIRESFRRHQSALPCVDIVIGLRAGVKAADNQQLRAALQQLWHRISTACTSSSAS